ncbi:MAG: SAM-dependent methyltransferase [Lawsonella clevelandensis]
MTSPSHSSTGRVILIGAGPGDPRLLTLAAVDALAIADVVFVDRLVSPAVLEHAPQAEIIQVGKTPYRRGGHSVTQHDINGLIVKAAKEGKTVARLKAGTPFFGRVGKSPRLPGGRHSRYRHSWHQLCPSSAGKCWYPGHPPRCGAGGHHRHWAFCGC